MLLEQFCVNVTEILPCYSVLINWLPWWGSNEYLQKAQWNIEHYVITTLLDLL